MALNSCNPPGLPDPRSGAASPGPAPMAGANTCLSGLAIRCKAQWVRGLWQLPGPVSQRASNLARKTRPREIRWEAAKLPSRQLLRDEGVVPLMERPERARRKGAWAARIVDRCLRPDLQPRGKGVNTSATLPSSQHLTCPALRERRHLRTFQRGAHARLTSIMQTYLSKKNNAAREPWSGIWLFFGVGT